MTDTPTEGWILAGAVDGRPPGVSPLARCAGLPLVLRHACELARAGCARAIVVWYGDAPPPDLAPLAADPRLAGCALSLVRDPEALSGGAGDVFVARADRVVHRDTFQVLAAAPAAPLRAIAGDDFDGAFAASRQVARDLAAAAARPDGLRRAVAALRAQGRVVDAEPPYLGFCAPVVDRRSLRRAEWQLIRSLRKAADGFAARAINRHLSLPITWVLARTPVRPNHITLLAFAAALMGGITLARGGYWAGVAGMLWVELGSILDGVDGELARVTCRFSRVGQWMDTVTDDAANVCYWTGTMLNLQAAGVGWAMPVWSVAVAAFAITQLSQYYLIATVYRSGDLAAIPWAFQSAEFLSARPRGFWPRVKAAVPKLLKRDFAVTLFCALAAAGRLDAVLAISAAGAVSFLVAFCVQLVRARPEVAGGRRAA